MKNTLTMISLLLAPASALAQLDPAEGKPPAVVEGRLYPTDGAYEVALGFGASINNKLNEHFGAVLTVNYNFSEWLALEAVGVGGFGRRTNLADDVRNGALGRWKDDIKSDEFSDNALLKASGQAGLRLEPIYGKLSLASEAALHFKVFASAGAGVAIVDDVSLVYCERFGGGKCSQYRNRQKPATPLVQGELGPTRLAFNLGGGMRVFFARWFALRVEVRDIIFQDALLKEINPKVVKAGNGSGKPDPEPGVTHIALFMGGISFLF